MKKFNVITIKWGEGFKPEEINKLYANIKRFTTQDIDFYCFTEHPEGLNENVIVKPLPVLNMNMEKNKFGYLKEAGLCDDNLGGLQGQRVFFFDIDSLIVGHLDEFFQYPQGEDFYIINDWASQKKIKKKNKVGQASCYSWVIGKLGYIKEYYEKNPEEVIGKYYTASQEYLSAKVIEKYGKLNFFPDNWFKSFRFHCMPHPLLRRFVMPRIPKVEGLKMISFHGVTGLQEAIDGVWCRPSEVKKYPRGFKRFYKYVLPTTWIKDYWRE